MTTSAIIMAIIGIVIIWGGGLALSILKAKNASND
ncbi:methionine/alanine import family NSS transporter small subunit [Gracilibacillus boraciitolerans]|nr:methionine/alanine import family NSS transporter small subunit [Gracilibacillus boraciitolerans]